MKGKTTTLVLALGLAALALAQATVVRMEARLTAAEGGEGKAKFKQATRSGQVSQQELEFEGEDLDPNTEYRLFVDGVQVGSATTNELGSFEWEARAVRQVKWNVSSGSVAKIENLSGHTLTGSFAVR